MTRIPLFLLVLLALTGCGADDAAPVMPPAPAWSNPIGVPTPPIGITEIAGATTSRTIPGTLRPGDVIDASGSHDNVTVHAACSARRPCYLRNGRYHTLRATGNGLIIENVRAYNPDLTLTYSALRDSEITGDRDGGGVFLSGSAYVTVRNVHIHDVGDLAASNDQDAHCLAPGTSGHHVWVLDSVLDHCSGDGVQVNAWNSPSEGLHHVYLARNTIHDNRQSALWAKQSRDVVFSENRGWGFHPSNGGQGPCYGSQYGSWRLVIIGNRGWECHYGINLRSSDDVEQPSTLIAWNVFHDTIRSSGQPDAAANVQTEGPCMLVMTNGPHAIVDNDCVRTYAGIQVPPGAGSVTWSGNIFWRLRDVVFAVGGATTITEGPNLKPPIDPQFVDALNFTLQAGSPAQRRGIADGVNAAYLSMTGQTYYAVHGVTLPDTGPRPDLGAFGPALLERRP